MAIGIAALTAVGKRALTAAAHHAPMLAQLPFVTLSRGALLISAIGAALLALLVPGGPTAI